jgi:hypothetical protein
MDDEKERKRLERKQRLLKGGADRLSKIVNSYSGSDDALPKDSVSDETLQAANSNESEAPNSLAAEKVEEMKDELHDSQPVPSEETPLLTTQETPTDSQPRINPAFVENDLVIPTLEDPFEFTEEVKPPLPKSDVLGWIHAFLFTSITAIIFGIWLKGHAHDLFNLDLDHQNVWNKKICRQLIHMSKFPVHYDLGASSAMNLLGYVMVMGVNDSLLGPCSSLSKLC